MYSVQELAQDLKVDTKTIYRLIYSGQLEACKVGRLWRIRQSAVDKYLRDNTYNPASGRAKENRKGRSRNARPRRSVDYGAKLDAMLRQVREQEKREKQKSNKPYVAVDNDG